MSVLDHPPGPPALASPGTAGAARLDLAAIAAQLAADPPVGLLPAGTRRRWALAARGPDHDAWIIAWPRGAGLSMHDHGGARAAVHVVSGELRERYVTEARTVALRHLTPGSTTELSEDHVHEMVNVGEDEAVSIHVYSPPLTDTDVRADAALELDVS
jgi:hypothetical protein